MKKIIAAIAVVLVIAAAGIFLLKLYRIQRDTTATLERQEIDGIVCIGDSLTDGAGDAGMGYPEILSGYMDEAGYIIPVYDLGVDGENTVTISGRLGAIPMKVSAFTIPSEITPVEIFFQDAYNGSVVSPLRQGSENNNGINPCVIDGVEGRIYIEQENYSSSEYHYYFVRSESGQEKNVSEGQEVLTFATNEYVDGIYIVFIGANGGFSDIEDLIYQQKLILNMQNKNKDKYLIVGIPSGTYEERKELEEAMEAEYGSRYINVRSLLSNEEVLQAEGVELSDTDKEQILQGLVPDCVRSDEIHFNSSGYRILAKEIYRRMCELGYFDEVNGYVQSFNRRWGLVHKLEIKLR